MRNGTVDRGCRTHGLRSKGRPAPDVKRRAYRTTSRLLCSYGGAGDGTASLHRSKPRDRCAVKYSALRFGVALGSDLLTPLLAERARYRTARESLCTQQV